MKLRCSIFLSRTAVLLALLGAMLAAPLMSAAQPNERGPIEINSDDDFTAVNGVSSGQGTADDPYVIENVIIDASGQDVAFALRNTTSHVIVRDCTLSNADSVGLQITDAQNITVTGCTTTGNRRGYNVVNSENVVLDGNHAVFNRQLGFAVFRSQNVELHNNISRNNWDLDNGEQSSWGIYSDEFSQTIGSNNQSSGHRFDIRVFKLVAEARDLPAEQQAGAETFDLFSTFPEEKQTSCDRVFNDYFLFVQSVDASAELDETYCAALYSSLSAMPIHFRSSISQIIFQGDSERILGAYTGIGTVRLWSIDNIKEFIEVVIHEMAHAAQSRLFTSELNSQWLSLFNDSGDDPDHYARTFTDFFTSSGTTFAYGTLNHWEDLATIMESYGRDTFALLERANRISDQTGKTLLLDKTRWLLRLLRLGSEPVAYRMLLGWDTEAETVSFQYQSAKVAVDNGLPLYADNLIWEEF